MISPLPQPTRREPLRPMPRKVIALVAAGIAVVTAGVVVWLWWAGTAGLSGKDLVTARLDALRTGLSIGIGGGGVFALYLAWRRQHATEVGLVQKERDQEDVARAYQLQQEVAEHNRVHAERVAEATEKDAADRRVTELYTKASEQLGSDKAPVRLAGIFALERLAQDNVEHRQTIVSLLCAYLRMPYLPPGDAKDSEHRERVQEREVRLTAQHVLATHLRPEAGAACWGEALKLNLNGATLLAADFARCHFGETTFDQAVFVDEADFTGTTFAERASFARTVFQERVFFRNAVFHKASFRSCKFEGVADFSDATFRKVAVERRRVYPGDTFSGAVFHYAAHFPNVTFGNGVDFSYVKAHYSIQFDGALFEDLTTFEDVSGEVECEGHYRALGPTRYQADHQVFASSWPDHWVVGPDGVITHRAE
ncbi:pentapeptide repeat-containing protein [Lentzea sp. NBRC 102530]|uniref:pentapeptide repeat-containing protein n=1 Tax=Lentzea sp. NBRC 102530 TaxID=3032201 RepID=UPI0024A126D8|nr:pentapeptide repeat-containing protein [Lentzea sp. NBRC 102530]GLY50734.1 hypothetical protein Lesp01_43900 [Lentzea sp. NBRC 102530]